MEIRNVASANTQMSVSTTKLGKSTEDGMKSENTTAKTDGTKMENKESATYSSVSKDGDTLELSEDKKSDTDSIDKVVIKEEKASTVSVILSDAALAKCSSTKLKQLLQQGKISKQQYYKAIKKSSK